MGDKDYCRCLVSDHAVQPLDPDAALDFVSDSAHGGIALFVGKVRRQNQGRAVTGIDYDLFQPLTLRQFERAADSALQRFGPALKVYLAHAYGSLSIGDVAVVVAAGSPHRDEAFRACRELIEAIKHEAPIWKREHYVDGSSAWSEGCSLCYRGDPGAKPTSADNEPEHHHASDHHGHDRGHAH